MTVSDFVGNGGGGLGKRKSVISADFLSSVFDGSIGGGGVGVVVVDLGDLGMMKTSFSGNKMASNLAGDFNAASRLSKFGTSFLTSTTASSVEADVVGQVELGEDAQQLSADDVTEIVLKLLFFALAAFV